MAAATVMERDGFRAGDDGNECAPSQKRYRGTWRSSFGAAGDGVHAEVCAYVDAENCSGSLRRGCGGGVFFGFFFLSKS